MASLVLTDPSALLVLVHCWCLLRVTPQLVWGKLGWNGGALSPEAAASLNISPFWLHCRPEVIIYTMYFWNFGDSDFLFGL